MRRKPRNEAPTGGSTVCAPAGRTGASTRSRRCAAVGWSGFTMVRARSEWGSIGASEGRVRRGPGGGTGRWGGRAGVGPGGEERGEAGVVGGGVCGEPCAGRVVGERELGGGPPPR